MSKKMGMKQKFQLKLMNVKGATVNCSSSNPKVATVTKKGLISTKKKTGKTKFVVSILKDKHVVQYVANVTVSKKVKDNYSLAKFSLKYNNPTIVFYKKSGKG